MKQYQIDRIKNLMDAKGITNQDLASKCGVSAMTISRLLTHTDHNPTTDTIEKIAEALGVHEQYIFEAETEAESKSKLSIRGFIEYNGKVSNIKKFDELENLYKSILYDRNISELVKEIKTKEEENKKSQCKTLNIADIDLFKKEAIDTKQICTHSFRSNNDIVEEKNNDLGNMASRYGFDLFNEHFHNSECAYICGLFSMNTPKCIEIQRELQASDNGYSAKKDIRRGYEKNAKECVRTDWATFNVEWMKLCVWTKCKENKDFRKMLLRVPENAIIIENSTYHHKPKEGEDRPAFWGARNYELEKKRDIIERSVIVNNPKLNKKELEEKINKARNSIHSFGVWEGTNCMGKILTLCKYHLHNHTELPIDYDLLHSKQIYLFGKLLTFDKELSHYPKKKEKKEKKVIQSSESPTPTTKNYKTIIFDFDGTLLDTELLKQYTYLFKGLERNSPEHKKGRKEYLSHVKDCPMFEGMDAVIDFIRKNHIKVAVVTANTKDRVVEAIKVHKWGDIISAKNIYGCYSLGMKMTTKDDGNPALFEYALKDMGLSASDCIALGNKPHDKVAANSVGVKAYHCLWGASDENKAVMLKDSDSLKQPIDIISVIEQSQKE